MSDKKDQNERTINPFVKEQFERQKRESNCDELSQIMKKMDELVMSLVSDIIKLDRKNRQLALDLHGCKECRYKKFYERFYKGIEKD